MGKTAAKTVAKLRRHRRVRKRVTGSADRPRLCVSRSNANMYAQVIDDDTGATLVSASSIDKEIKGSLGAGGTVEAATQIGELIAKRCRERGISAVVFDRGGNLFHGRVKSLADGARKGGLEF